MEPAIPVEVEDPEASSTPTSKMRSHKGNQPVLPQDKQCPHCSARFTRTTHLNRHMRNHTKEGLHNCDLCGAEFTRSDLLSRHVKTCSEKQGSARRKSCAACTDSKVKCDREVPCGKCKTKGKECVYPATRRRASRIPSHAVSQDILSLGPGDISEFGPAHLVPHAGPSEFSYNPALHSSPAPLDPGVASGSAVSSRYHTDIFQPFFASVFGSADSPPSDHSQPNPFGADAFPFATNSLSSNIFAGGQYPSGFPDMHPGRSLQAPVSNLRGSPTTIVATTSSSDSSSTPETEYYVHLFYTEFLKQMPIAHEGTFRHERKALVLVSAIAACGALFVRTRAAADFITKALNEARDSLLQEFARNTAEVDMQVHLVLAVCLLQTIGLFHQSSTERASSNIYHGMVVMMIRTSGLVQKTAQWKAEVPTAATLDQCWRAWALHEMTKRCLWLSYCHDTTHAIFFALGSSYHPDEMNGVKLPTEDRLFAAKTAGDWLRALQDTSQYGSIPYRMAGLEMGQAHDTLSSPDLARELSPIPPLAHFVLVHRILRRLFEVATAVASTPGPNQSDEMILIQNQLHKWLGSWLSGPDTPRMQNNIRREEPRFMDNALPYYWLGQVSILAFQDGHPPFRPLTNGEGTGEARFRLIKRWLKHIRQWIDNCDETPTLYWDGMMKYRLEAWQAEPLNLNEEQYQGIVAFFPDKP